MTQDNGMDASPSWQELKDERDAALREAGYWKTLSERLSRDKQALAAQVERLKEAEAAHQWDEDRLSAMIQVLEDSPTTSLASLKAQWQAEALSRYQPESHWEMRRFGQIIGPDLHGHGGEFLALENFHIDGFDNQTPAPEVLLRLVIGQLMRDLDRFYEMRRQAEEPGHA